MHIVEIRLSRIDVAARMEEMRRWLDARGRLRAAATRLWFSLSSNPMPTLPISLDTLRAA